MANVLTETGRAMIVRALGQEGSGNGSAAPTYSGIGTGAGTAGTADTGLFTEVQSRVNGTKTYEQTTSAGDTFRVVAQHVADAARAITNAGLFDASSAGNLFVKGDFAVINLANGDSLTLTYNVSFA